MTDEFEPLSAEACANINKIRMPSVTLYQLPKSTDGVRTQASITKMRLNCSLSYDKARDAVEIILTNYNLEGRSMISRAMIDDILTDCCNNSTELHEHEHIISVIDSATENVIAAALSKGIQLMIPDREHVLSGGYGAIFDAGNAVAAFRELGLTVTTDEASNEPIFAVRIKNLRTLSGNDYQTTRVLSASYLMLGDDGTRLAKYAFPNIGNGSTAPVLRTYTELRAATDAASIQRNVDQRELDSMMYIQRYRPPGASQTQSRFADILRNTNIADESDTVNYGTQTLRDRFSNIKKEV